LGERPKPYERPTLPFERKAVVPSAALRWSAAGFQFALAVVLFFLGGRALDAKVGTGPWLSLVGAMVGIAVGTYLLIRPALRSMSRSPRDRSEGATTEGEQDE
jgi:hypothetical protein